MICMLTIQDADDRIKFCQIDQIYRQRMYGIARRICHNSADAEDAVQNAMISIAEHIEQLDEVSSPRTRSYVSIVVERKALDIRKSQMTHPTVDFDDTMMGVVYDRGAKMDLRDSILRLPAIYKEILLLHYANGYTIAETAQILGREYESTKKMLQRAKAKLEELLKGDGLL